MICRPTRTGFTTPRWSLAVGASIALLGWVGCSSSPTSTSAGSGGRGSAGGSASGGNVGSGGTSASGGNVGSGGTSGSGGKVGSGGTSGSGGNVGTGGTSSTGGNFATGGTSGTGSGGTTGTGGRGGTTGTGGRGGTTVPGSGGQGGGGGQGGRAVKLPTGNAAFDYQIGGGYTPASGVAIVSRDRSDSPAKGLYNICYVNGFQIQPGEATTWMTSYPDLILKDAQGKAVIDADWNEMLVDTSTATKREALLKVVGPWIDGCAAKGFDAVEIDNLDSYGRSQGLLTQDNNVAFMGMLSARAHAAGLAAGQKNAADLVARAPALGTDFAVAEECNRYSECDVYKKGYGTRVFVIEYRRQDFDVGCSTQADLSIVLRDVNVTKPGSSTYVFDGC